METASAMYAWWLAAHPRTRWEEWKDWRWQMRQAITSAEALGALFPGASTRGGGEFGMRITPYYAGVLAQAPALMKSMVPHEAETGDDPEELDDPLGEERHSPVPRVIHTYPHKALFLATDCCAVHCRYCTRSRWVGRGAGGGEQDWEAGLDYIRRHTEIRDVLISGGDPLLLGDARLERLLRELRGIRHVEILRIGTKAPAALPQRVTPALARMLRRYHPVWMVLHFTHEAELTPECGAACGRLADAGLPLAAQTVLLRDINDDAGGLQRLMQGLLRYRVKPYYLLQCDAVRGGSRFRVPLAAGQELWGSLHGYASGLAAPLYMVDAPGGGGKVPVSPCSIVRREGPHWILRDYRGGETRYYDPGDGGQEL